MLETLNFWLTGLLRKRPETLILPLAIKSGSECCPGRILITNVHPTLPNAPSNLSANTDLRSQLNTSTSIALVMAT